ncbi:MULTISPECIES: cation:proton antiporter domain-containing protein [unclassified Modestobacter]|uniref:cation:proton antiporter domain-containing protein n=1 Tax=unclassified Modestobacter TaxID=2643866 RepID=UPI0022AA9198|nr:MULTISPECIES: cation:proton antiporter [unclassified Modestobacter]MCZ2824778.1 cation:proton antiporter [Modestobacter sp. VKM Ac-2981]MCZ2854719.1 cation:proton antiporter [Modestobacter sp. VKM Ac-2982]
MDPTGLAYAVAGAAALLTALLPRLLRRLPISLPMVVVAIGVAVFAAVDRLPTPDPLEHELIAVHLTEACVIVSLLGAGLALDRRLGWRRWSTTWRLLGITMPLTVAATALLGGWLLGLGAAAAVLLAAALAPTDPVLATEVQVDEPTGEAESEDEARFALTSEAGLNDGLAFPFTYAAVAMATLGAAPSNWLGEWLLFDVVWRIAAGVAVGVGVGWALRAMFFSAGQRRAGLVERAEGFVALAIVFLAYGVAELIEGYGFVAVFVCACTIRAAERAHGHHQVLHTYVEQLERLLTVVVLVLLGGAVARGALAGLSGAEVGLAVVLVLVVRPLAGWLGLLRGRTGPRERSAISFFGVRGIGSLYYLAYGLSQAEFAGAEQLWRVTVLVVLVSVIVHGMAATPVMTWLDRRRQRAAAAVRGEEAAAPVTPV